MNLRALCSAVLASSLALSANAASLAVNPADYTETVHVLSSRLFRDLSEKNNVPAQELTVTIAGKHYILTSDALLGDVHVVGGIHPGLIPLGDYKAKLNPRPAFKPDFLLFASYDLLLPDGKPHRFEVTGASE